MIRDVSQSDLEPVRAFLEAHLDSSLFLLSNLATYGPTAGEHPNSGPYRLVEEGGQTIAVFCLTRRGNLLVQGRHKWPGHSGEVYTYDIHEWPTRLSPGPGNFILASNSAGPWRAVLIGESGDLAELRWQPSRHQGVTHIHVRLNFNPVAVRRREVSDLACRWQPPGQDVVA